MAASTLRVGVIGCGDLGAIHARRLSRIDGVRVAALCDPTAGAVEQVASQLPAPPEILTGAPDQLLAAGLDAVCIASPDAYHVRQTLAALAAGLHVLCEKPLTLQVAELEAVVAAQQATGKVVILTNPRRYDGGIRAIRREVRSGRWGAVRRTVVATAEDWVTPYRGTWRHDPTICPGGFIYDAGMHQLDTLLWCTGLRGEWVDTRSDNCGTDVPLATWGSGALEGGVPLSLSLIGDAHAWRENVSIFCEGADFVVQNGRVAWTQNGRLVPIEPLEPSEDAEDVFVRLVREGGQAWSEPASVRPVLQLTRAALLSAQTGKPAQVSA